MRRVRRILAWLLAVACAAGAVALTAAHPLRELGRPQTPSRPSPALFGPETATRTVTLTADVRYRSDRLADVSIEAVARTRIDDPVVRELRAGRSVRSLPSVLGWLRVESPLLPVDDISAPELTAGPGGSATIRVRGVMSGVPSNATLLLRRYVTPNEGKVFASSYALTLRVQDGTVQAVGGDVSRQDARSVEVGTLGNGPIWVRTSADGLPIGATSRNSIDLTAASPGWVIVYWLLPLLAGVLWLAMFLMALPASTRERRWVLPTLILLVAYGTGVVGSVVAKESGLSVTLFCVAAPALMVRLAHPRLPFPAVVALAAAAAALLFGTARATEPNPVPSLLLAGLCWAALPYSTLRILLYRPPLWLTGALVALTVLIGLGDSSPPDGPVALLDYPRGAPVTSYLDMFLLVVYLVFALLPVLGVAILATRPNLGLRVRRWIGLILGAVALSLPAQLAPGWLIVFGVALTSTFFVLPLGRTERCSRLDQVTPAVHTRLLRLEARRRVLDAAAGRLRKDVQAALATGELTPAGFDARMRELDALGRARPRAGFVTVREAALGSNAGYPASRNGLVALALGLFLQLPVLVYFVSSARPPETFPLTLFWTDSLTGLMAPAFLAFLYGYFYPYITGTHPLTKAVALGMGLLPVYLAVLLIDVNRDALILFGLRMGNLVAFCLILGLWWERRLVHAAGFSWRVVRELRQIRHLGTPLTAVLVAVATATATVLANASTSAWLQPPAKSEMTITGTPALR